MGLPADFCAISFSMCLLWLRKVKKASRFGGYSPTGEKPVRFADKKRPVGCTGHELNREVKSDLYPAPSFEVEIDHSGHHGGQNYKSSYKRWIAMFIRHFPVPVLFLG